MMPDGIGLCQNCAFTIVEDLIENHVNIRHVCLAISLIVLSLAQPQTSSITNANHINHTQTNAIEFPPTIANCKWAVTNADGESRGD